MSSDLKHEEEPSGAFQVEKTAFAKALGQWKYVPVEDGVAGRQRERTGKQGLGHAGICRACRGFAFRLERNMKPFKDFEQCSGGAGGETAGAGSHTLRLSQVDPVASVSAGCLSGVWNTPFQSQPMRICGTEELSFCYWSLFQRIPQSVQFTVQRSSPA